MCLTWFLVHNNDKNKYKNILIQFFPQLFYNFKEFRFLFKTNFLMKMFNEKQKKKKWCLKAFKNNCELFYRISVGFISF